MRIHKLHQHTEQICHAYLQGAGLIIISKTYGASPGTIRNILIRLNVPLRKRGRPQGQHKC